MAQQYYEYVNYKDEHVHEQKKLPKGACHKYIIVFQSVFNLIFNVSLHCSFFCLGRLLLCSEKASKQMCFFLCVFLPLLSPLLQLSLVLAECPMLFVLNDYLDTNKHILFGVKACGKDTTL